MVAVGEDPEAALAGVGLLEHHLHAHVLLAFDRGKGEAHAAGQVLLVGVDVELVVALLVGRQVESLDFFGESIDQT